MYYRVTRYNFNSSKYDALMAQTDGVKGELRAISGLAFVHVCRTGDDEGMVIAQYDSQASADAAHQQTLAILGGMAQFMTSAPQQQMGEVIWRTDDLTPSAVPNKKTLLSAIREKDLLMPADLGGFYQPSNAGCLGKRRVVKS